MRRIILACALAAILSVPAKADETLKFRVVQYVASQQFHQVGDVTGHVQGIQRYIGIASFPDGSTGRTTAWNMFDGVTGTGNGGTSNGYQSIVFSDGSELWIKYSGPYKVVSQTPDALHVSGNTTFTITGGKGRYAGAKGDGTAQNDKNRVGSAIPGETLGVTDVVMNIKK
jgi:hypothetical protein